MEFSIAVCYYAVHVHMYIVDEHEHEHAFFGIDPRCMVLTHRHSVDNYMYMTGSCDY